MDDATIKARLSEATRLFWGTRAQQVSEQQERGQADQGARSAVTGGAQMDGFVMLLSDLIQEAGIETRYIFEKKKDRFAELV